MRSACRLRMGTSLVAQPRTTPTSAGPRSSRCQTERCSPWIVCRQMLWNDFGGCPHARMAPRPLLPQPKGSERCALIAGASVQVPCETRSWRKSDSPTGDASVPFAASTKRRDIHQPLRRESLKSITWHHSPTPQRLCVQRLPTSPSFAPTVTGPCTPRQPWTRTTRCLPRTFTVRASLSLKRRNQSPSSHIRCSRGGNRARTALRATRANPAAKYSRMAMASSRLSFRRAPTPTRPAS